MPMKYLCLLFTLLISLSLPAARSYSFHSPSSRLVLKYTVSNGAAQMFLCHGETVLTQLHLGLELAEETFDLATARRLHFKSQWSEGNYNEYLMTSRGNALRVRFRLFDDALAFRYESIQEKPAHLVRENSSWTLSPQTRVWYFERRNAWKLKSYAGTWEETKLSDMAQAVSSPVQGTPLVCQLPCGLYSFISEAALAEYSGLRLKLDGNRFIADFTEGNKGFELPPAFHTPWRLFFVGDDLNALVNQKVIRALHPKPDPRLYADTSYIRPGKSAWRWFSQGTGTPAEERDLITAAARLNFIYSTVDDGWQRWSDKWNKVKKLAAYGRQRHVGLFLWFNSRSLQSKKEDYRYMRELLDSVAWSGAVGVKVDFMDSEARQLIDFELRLLQECAKRSLLVNFHGCQKSTGEYYSYPNEVTREGIRGLELNKMREGYITAAHNAALPFTRFVVGHADYTPLSFTVPGATTFAHQLATLVCFDSYMQTIAESPELLLSEPVVRPALGLVRAVPTVWDEVRVLPQSEIGKLAILAKRSGNDWYIGILNGENKEKILQLDLNPFVQGRAVIETYTDDLLSPRVLLSMKGHRPGVMKREPSVPFKKEICTTTLPQLHLAPNGGGVIVVHHNKIP